MTEKNPNVKIGQVVEQKPDEELRSIASLMASGSESEFWRVMKDRLSKRRDLALSVLRNESIVGVGASNIARAQGAVSELDFIINFPEMVVKQFKSS